MDPSVVVDFSVVICTYNGEQHLPRLLEQLRSQLIPNGLTWEILIIDNNSSDQTAHYIRTQQQRWPHPYPLRYRFAPSQGLGYARRCAIHSVNSDLVGFLDDDTLPAPDWVAQVCDFAQRHPQVGTYGSAIDIETLNYLRQGGGPFGIIPSCG